MLGVAKNVREPWHCLTDANNGSPEVNVFVASVKQWHESHPAYSAVAFSPRSTTGWHCLTDANNGSPEVNVFVASVKQWHESHPACSAVLLLYRGVRGVAPSHSISQTCTESSQRLQGRYLVRVADFRRTDRRTQPFQVGIVKSPIHPIRLPVLAAVSKTVGGRIAVTDRSVVDHLG